MVLKKIKKGARRGCLAIWDIARPTPFVIVDPDAEKLRLVAAMLAAAGWGQYLKTVEPIPFDGFQALRYEIPAGFAVRESFSAAYWQISRSFLPQDPDRVKQREQWREQARRRIAKKKAQD